MSVWDSYEARADAHGKNKRTAFLNREVRMLQNKTGDNLSYQKVTIDGRKQRVSIIDSDNLNEKTIISYPNEDIKLGGLVHWMDNFWLITEQNANKTVYTKCKMVQCNHLLKWVSDDKVIHKQWCIVEDGTKYLTGEYEDRNFVVTRGDSRIAMTIARNELTVNFNRENRFLIDDMESSHKLAYQLTKPLKLGGTYNNEGVYKFVLQEVTATTYDNHELGIADYYKYFPRENFIEDNFDIDNTDNIEDEDNANSSDINSGKKVWL